MLKVPVTASVSYGDAGVDEVGGVVNVVGEVVLKV